MRAGITAAVLCVLMAGTAAAEPQPPFSHAGRFITDSTGRVFTTHGVNMVYKVAPYEPTVAGFGDDDAAFLASEGFNSVRLGVIYKAVEPAPGSYDEAYIAKVAQTAAVLERHGVTPLIDFHQDLYNERFQGEGWPDWAVIDDGLPAQPQAGFPSNYLVQPGLNRAFDNFWANTAGPGGVGLVDRYAAAWTKVAAAFAGDRWVLGYDLMNEPWPGNGWQQCINPAGCPAFDQGEFADFWRKAIAGVRASDARHLVFYEPAVLFNFGAGTQLPKFQDDRLGMSWHNYCLVGAAGGGGGGSACQAQESLPFQNASKRSDTTKDTQLLTEFGATDDLDTLNRITAASDQYMVGWQYWQYCGCSDPTTQGPGDTQAIVKDPAKPPTGDNLKSAKLDVLVRPYPQLVAGTPSGWRFDPDTKAFELSYATARAGGGSFSGRPLTEVFVPKRQYPGGYAVKVTGASVASAPGAQVLLLQACPGAKAVHLAIAKTGANAADCAAPGAKRQSLRLTVTPRRAHRGVATTFRFRVRAGRFAIHGARVRFAGHRASTDRNGRARIRVRMTRAGIRRARATKATFRAGSAQIRIVR